MKRDLPEEIFVKEYPRLLVLMKQYMQDSYEGVEAVDVIQDVALNLFSRPDLDSMIENFTAYLYTSVRNRIKNIRTRKKPVKPLSQFADSVQKAISELDEETEAEIPYWESPGLQANLRKAIEKLAPHEQMILLETDFNNRTFESLSDEWGIPVGTLLARKHRTLAKLRKLLEQDRKPFIH